MTDRAATRQRVVEIVADALDVNRADVLPHASLIDDLGAESIDFLDILFRLETAFGVTIPENEIWKGSIDPDNQESIDRGVQQLRQRMPNFAGSKLPDPVTRNELPRLITVQTVVDYLESRLSAR